MRRQVGCHACCKEYNDVKKAVEERKKQVREAKLANEEFMSYHKDMSDKIRRKRDSRNIKWKAY